MGLHMGYSQVRLIDADHTRYAKDFKIASVSNITYHIEFLEYFFPDVKWVIRNSLIFC